ncbi:zinc-binding dehydrogenase [Solirubrobacter ginsenosidimutans]|uniref:Zinc-binding dehydrogenase n=1 Tax=Solirubrobacter ginsenosidimutans TaxID=490573 RepID=A0A9X3S396_9ACTN|nr:zinc-binding dehydrogenase [Solirubrobacter ginsenosidimutans]MDA0159238.1 zinc-binding dehydrogenase [Solirubrobacter ginsenosidimutans]
MRAVVATAHGGPEVLEVRDEPEPRPDDRMATVRVASAGVNFSDLLAISGRYPGPTPPFVPGIEVAGHESESGRPVLALVPSAGYAEIVRADRRLLFDAEGMDLAQAGGYPLVTLAAYFGLVHAARLARGETVLVLAAAGGLGSAALQVARALGAGRVLAVASTEEKRALALTHGADAAYAYDEPLPAADVVVDGVGGDAFLNAYRATRPLGRVLLVGASSGTPPAFPGFQELRERAVALVPFSFKALRERSPEFVAREAPRGLDLVRRGEVRPLVAATEPLEAAGEALRRLGGRASVGKLVLRP